jgi:hypothetical protein
MYCCPTLLCDVSRTFKTALSVSPTDHLCPGGSFCCQPTATCVSTGCTVAQPSCLTFSSASRMALIDSPTDHLCPGGSFCCQPTATCVSTGCTVSQAQPSCATYFKRSALFLLLVPQTTFVREGASVVSPRQHVFQPVAQWRRLRLIALREFLHTFSS